MDSKSAKKIENIKAQDFGIEIEVEGISREMTAKAIAGYFGKYAKYMGDSIGYSAWGFKDDEGRLWKCVSDSSLANGGCEIVSPICYYKDIKIIEDIIEILDNLGAKVSYRTGIHIHIGAKKMTANQIRNLVNSFSSHEDMIFRALEVDYHRQCEYCQKTDSEFLKKLNEEKPENLVKLFDLWYKILSPYDSREQHYNPSRYHAVNLHATYTKGTVEFRMFNSILEKEKVASYIIFCMALIAHAIDVKRVSSKKVNSCNEKFSMRSWLRQLGLNGEEFRICRHTFLEKLAGDLANKEFTW